MNKKISLILVTVLLASLSLGTFVACAGENIDGNWQVDWDKFNPSLDNDTLPPEGEGSEDEDDNQTSDGNGNEDDEQEEVIQPTVKYSYMIRSNVNRLTIRSAPSTSASILGYMDKDDMLRYESVSNGWYKTVYKQRTAYVYAGNNYAYIIKMQQTNEQIEQVIAIGEELMGYPYVWGSQRYHWGNGILNTNFVQGEYDCSALMQYIYFIGAGVKLDLTTRTQVLQGTKVASGDLRRGDLMFFTNAQRYNNTGVERVGHVAMYLGDNYILHTASDHAVIEQISSTRWSYFIVAKRFL